MKKYKRFKKIYLVAKIFYLLAFLSGGILIGLKRDHFPGLTQYLIVTILFLGAGVISMFVAIAAYAGMLKILNDKNP